MATVTVGRLNRTARTGIINLIPKKAKNQLLIRNWRPITLLCVDMKIWSKAIANRLEETTHLIGLQQQGFIKGRGIFNNIQTTVEILAYPKKQNRPGILVSIDFEKCFDRVEFASIQSMFKYFRFGDNFTRMMLLLFTDLELCTYNNGYFSEYLKKGRGTNQGDPASPLIYCYCGEIMTHMINNNRGIEGIELNGIKQILSQFADDTAAFIKYEKLVLDTFIDTLQHIEKQMGLKVSYEKTTLYRIGSLRESLAELITQKNFQWSSGPIDILGVKINCDGTNHNENFAEIMQKVSVCKTWINRTLTLHGKVLVLNTLIGSLFVYKLSLNNVVLD